MEHRSWIQGPQSTDLGMGVLRVWTTDLIMGAWRLGAWPLLIAIRYLKEVTFLKHTWYMTTNNKRGNNMCSKFDSLCRRCECFGVESECSTCNPSGDTSHLHDGKHYVNWYELNEGEVTNKRISVEFITDGGCAEYCGNSGSPICMTCLCAIDIEYLDDDARAYVMRAYMHIHGNAIEKRPRWLASQLVKVANAWADNSPDQGCDDIAQAIWHLASYLDPTFLVPGSDKWCERADNE